MSPYTIDRPDLARIALIRELTDEMRQEPTLRAAGLGARRKIAARIVDAAMSRQERETSS